ncbi:MAG TPA: hypothetical protein VFS32_06945, partial [Candidatus Limnocylindrales bacterium]|nr:hypothetical protein [Candidatus Limnocylindrales bacterium]
MIATAEAGRDAVRRHSWTEAVEAFTAVDQDATLAPDDLELLGTATWWSGQPGEATDALERAFGGYSDAGRDEDAARTAITLAYLAFRRLEESIAFGWIARAERLLEGLPDSPLHAWPLAFGALGALVANQIEAGLALADRAIEVARERGNTDALFMAMSFRGMGRLETGDWRSGLRDIDEAAAAATSGQLDIRFASDIFCTTIAACRSLGDLARAGQWTNE